MSPADAYPVFDRLVSAYSEPHRFYHTLEHLSEMFKVAGKLSDAADNRSRGPARDLVPRRRLRPPSDG